MSEPKVIYENPDFLVVNKPSGLMVHGVRIGDRGSGIGHRESAIADKKEKTAIPHTPYPIPEPTLVDWLLERYPEIGTVGDDPAQRPGIVHRLDKDTSGVMLIARNQKTFEYLKSLFQKHEIVKTYRAIVVGKLKKDEGVIDKPIGILTGSTKRSVHSKKMVKEAVTEYKVVKNYPLPITHYQLPHYESFSLLELHPKTGRTHQIRVHLASVGHPIVGDVLYGPKNLRNRVSGIGNRASAIAGKEKKSAIPYARLMLHALSLEFIPHDGKKMRFEAEEPEEFREFLNSLE